MHECHNRNLTTTSLRLFLRGYVTYFRCHLLISRFAVELQAGIFADLDAGIASVSGAIFGAIGQPLVIEIEGSGVSSGYSSSYLDVRPSCLSCRVGVVFALMQLRSTQWLLCG